MGKNKKHNKITFKTEQQNQLWLMPPSLDELIDGKHLVRTVNRVMDKIDMEPFLKECKGGGTSTFHPRVMLKALVFAYIEGIYSSRKIEKALKENVVFMWLCGMSRPDHNTINRFRNGALKDTIKSVFGQVLLMLVEEKMVNLNRYHVDGTKMESVANRYTFVWQKNVARHKAKLVEKISAIMEDLEEKIEKSEAEDTTNEGGSMSEEKLDAAVEEINDGIDNLHKKEENPNKKEAVINSESVEETVKKINEEACKIVDEALKKMISKQCKELKNKLLPKLKEYEVHEKNLGERNSYSKTDIDATFMRTKDDHMKNGQLKPCYNLQLGTENQFIINYTTHQQAGDTSTFKEHMGDTKALLEDIGQKLPKNISADAAYGSEENYEFLEEEELIPYVKYNKFYLESKGKAQKKISDSTYWYYNEELDFCVCPMGQRLERSGTSKKKSANGYESIVFEYTAKDCSTCPMRGACYDAKGDQRTISRNHRLQELRKNATELLNSWKGWGMRKQRNVDVEAVFGHIKRNRGFSRFMLRSLPKVNIEMGLIAIAHNIKKMHQRLIFLAQLPPEMKGWQAGDMKRPAFAPVLDAFGSLLRSFTFVFENLGCFLNNFIQSLSSVKKIEATSSFYF